CAADGHRPLNLTKGSDAVTPGPSGPGVARHMKGLQSALVTSPDAPVGECHFPQAQTARPSPMSAVVDVVSWGHRTTRRVAVGPRSPTYNTSDGKLAGVTYVAAIGRRKVPLLLTGTPGPEHRGSLRCGRSGSGPD